MAEAARINADDVKQKLDTGEPVFFIDTRNKHDWNESDVMIPGAVRIHYSELERRLDEVPREQSIVTYCT